MSQLFVRGIGSVVAVAVIGVVPLACQLNQGSGGDEGDTGASGAAAKVGVPCAPPDERSPYFGGFKVSENVIIAGAQECGAGVCLLNHFQGEVACPLGQAQPLDAQGLPGCTPSQDAMGNPSSGQGSCDAGDMCVMAGSVSPRCDLSLGQEDADKFCGSAGGHCGTSGVCECQADSDCAFVNDAAVRCDPQAHQCVTYACHKPGSCQDPNATDAENAGKACCTPGTDAPVTKAVCGQCRGLDGQTTRDADSAVYCTCRCGVADGEPDDPDYPFCACPDGFECSEIRKNLGLGDMNLTGKYCIKAGTAYEANKDQCGLVDGHWEAGCAGISSGGAN